MRRARLGCGVLAALLAACLAVTWGMGRLHEPIARDLELAGEAALAGDEAAARVLAEKAGAEWARWRHLRGCFCDHAPAEEADGAFAALRMHAALGERSDFAAGCMALARQVRAVGEAHGLNWWNVL